MSEPHLWVSYATAEEGGHHAGAKLSASCGLEVFKEGLDGRLSLKIKEVGSLKEKKGKER